MPPTPYTTDRWEELRPKFLRWAKASALLTALLTVEVVSTDGDIALLRTPKELQNMIDMIWFLSLGVFLVTGGMLLWVWLVNRYGDR